MILGKHSVQVIRKVEELVSNRLVTILHLSPVESDGETGLLSCGVEMTLTVEGRALQQIGDILEFVIVTDVKPRSNVIPITLGKQRSRTRYWLKGTCVDCGRKCCSTRCVNCNNIYMGKQAKGKPKKKKEQKEDVARIQAVGN